MLPKNGPDFKAPDFTAPLCWRRECSRQACWRKVLDRACWQEVDAQAIERRFTPDNLSRLSTTEIFGCKDSKKLWCERNLNISHDIRSHGWPGTFAFQRSWTILRVSKANYSESGNIYRRRVFLARQHNRSRRYHSALACPRQYILLVLRGRNVVILRMLPDDAALWRKLGLDKNIF